MHLPSSNRHARQRDTADSTCKCTVPAPDGRACSCAFHSTYRTITDAGQRPSAPHRCHRHSARTRRAPAHARARQHAPAPRNARLQQHGCSPNLMPLTVTACPRARSDLTCLSGSMAALRAPCALPCVAMLVGSCGRAGTRGSRLQGSGMHRVSKSDKCRVISVLTP